MVLVWVTFFKVTIIERQITRKWYNIELYLQWMTNRIESRSIWSSVERHHFQWPWMTTTPSFKVTLFFDAVYLRNGTRYRHSCNEILVGTYSTVSFGMILSDLEWLSKIFIDTKRRAVPLRQLSFLLLLLVLVLLLLLLWTFVERKIRLTL